MNKKSIHLKPFQNLAPRIPRIFLRHLVIAGATFFSILTASADILTVANTNASGGSSLRSFIGAANAGDIIVFDQLLDGQTITLDGTDIDIDKDLVIDASSLLNGITIDGNGASRIFDVTGGAQVALISLKLQNGAETSSVGGAIKSNGTLRIVDCVISNNTAMGAGAIDAFGALVILNSTISGNTANNIAGIYASRTNLTISGSTISGHTGLSGPGDSSDAIRFESDGSHTFNLYNSTVSGNSANNRAGGITVAGFNSGTVTANFFNATITSNTRTSGGGAGGVFIVQGDSSTVKVRTLDSIISGNTANGQPSDILGNLESNSLNSLIGVGGGLTNGVNGNIVGVTDPMLSPLQDNGGPTLTHIPITGSPAVDASVGILDFDQRGNSRPFGAASDIGAVEGVDHTAARAALNAQIAAQTAAIASLQAQAKGFQKKAKKAKSKSKARKFKQRARKVAGQASIAQIQLGTLQNRLAELN